jgi:hypothetical protein
MANSLRERYESSILAEDRDLLLEFNPAQVKQLKSVSALLQKLMIVGGDTQAYLRQLLKASSDFVAGKWDWKSSLSFGKAHNPLQDATSFAKGLGKAYVAMGSFIDASLEEDMKKERFADMEDLFQKADIDPDQAFKGFAKAWKTSGGKTHKKFTPEMAFQDLLKTKWDNAKKALNVAVGAEGSIDAYEPERMETATPGKSTGGKPSRDNPKAEAAADQFASKGIGSMEDIMKYILLLNGVSGAQIKGLGKQSGGKRKALMSDALGKKIPGVKLSDLKKVTDYLKELGVMS